jgi:coniferyl-aldehyde dehydrogenase
VISLNGDQPDRASRQLPLYAVVNPPEGLAVMQEETFGPIIAAKPYETVGQAIRYINERPRPLAAYVVTREPKQAEQYARDVIAGGVGVNVFGFQGADPGLPFGGIGASGMGCHSGFEGFLNYTHQKAVFDCADDNPLMIALKGPYAEMAHAFADAVFPPS